MHIRVQMFIGATNTQAALRIMHTEQFSVFRGDRPNIPNIAILLTDGESTIEQQNTIPEAAEAREKSITIFR